MCSTEDYYTYTKECIGGWQDQRNNQCFTSLPPGKADRLFVAAFESNDGPKVSTKFLSLCQWFTIEIWLCYHLGRIESSMSFGGISHMPHPSGYTPVAQLVGSVCYPWKRIMRLYTMGYDRIGKLGRHSLEKSSVDICVYFVLYY